MYSPKDKTGGYIILNLDDENVFDEIMTNIIPNYQNPSQDKVILVRSSIGGNIGDYFTSIGSINIERDKYEQVQCYVVPVTDFISDGSKTVNGVTSNSFHRYVIRVYRDYVSWSSEEIKCESHNYDFSVLLPEEITDEFDAYYYNNEYKSQQALNYSGDTPIVIKVHNQNHEFVNNTTKYIFWGGSSVCLINNELYFCDVMKKSYFAHFKKITFESTSDSDIYEQELKIELTSSSIYDPIWIKPEKLNVINFKFIDNKNKTSEIVMDDVYNYNQIIIDLRRDIATGNNGIIDYGIPIILIARDSIGTRQSGYYWIKVTTHTSTSSATQTQLTLEFVYKGEVE